MPSFIHVHLVLGSTIDLLDVAVDAHLVQHVGNGRQHIGHAADGDNVGGKTIGIASLRQQGLCLLRIIGKMIQAVVVGGGTGNCPLVGHLCHAHQECCVDGIHIDGVAQGAADTGIGPGAVNGTVGDQTQCTNAHMPAPSSCCRMVGLARPTQYISYSLAWKAVFAVLDSVTRVTSTESR